MVQHSEDALAERVAGFVRGHDSIPYDRVVVCHDASHKCVLVLSYTDTPEGSRPTESEALSKVSHSREVVEALKARYPSFALVVKDAALRFEFCRDYGKGAIKLAHLEGERLRWVNDC
jgi:hypothetical protein